MTIQPVLTDDGSMTLFIPELNEHYHSVYGAIRESRHIFMKEGFDKIETSPACIFEVGFGTGLNAFLTLLASEKEGKAVHYSAVEKYPVEDELIRQMNYPELINPAKAELFHAIHNAPWDREVSISEYFTLFKIKGDLCDIQLKHGIYDLVFFDAFGPDVQPELWTEEIFRMISRSMKGGATLVTYSVKGTVTRAMKAAGFGIEKLPGPPGKRHITRATKMKV